MAKMLITEALDERDFLEKKIKDKIKRASFVGLKKNNEDNVANSSKSAEEFEADAKSELQSIKDLISRYYAIDGQIIKSNAETIISILDDTTKLSVAEAISIRQKLCDDCLQKMLAEKLEREHELAAVSASEYRTKLERNAQSLRETISSKESESGYGVVDEYIKANSISVIGIANAKDEAGIIVDSVEEFLAAINTAIKVSNATTYIEI